MGYRAKPDSCCQALKSEIDVCNGRHHDHSALTIEQHPASSYLDSKDLADDVLCASPYSLAALQTSQIAPSNLQPPPACSNSNANRLVTRCPSQMHLQVPIMHLPQSSRHSCKARRHHYPPCLPQTATVSNFHVFSRVCRSVRA